MDFIPEKINDYCKKYSTPESEVLQQLNRFTNVNVLRPRMLSGHLQGKLLEFISCMIQPKNVLEVGTYTGYSAICLAKGLQMDGKILTIDCNEELEDIVLEHIAKAGCSDKIDFIIGDAVNILPNLMQEFDLVFIDADKEQYSLYFDLIFDKVKPGGFILVDNVLWSGKVSEKISPSDKETLAIQAFNQKVHDDSRVENFLLPFRDGLMLLRKL